MENDDQQVTGETECALCERVFETYEELVEHLSSEEHERRYRDRSGRRRVTA